MVVYTYEDILWSKLDKILGDIKLVKVYICDILVLSKNDFQKHIY